MFYNNIICVITIIYYFGQGVDSSSPKCNLILRRHNVFDGIGVIAGRKYNVGDIIESMPAITVPLNYTTHTMLDYYATSHIPDFDNIVFGNVLMYNHDKNPSARFQSPVALDVKRKGFVGSKLRVDLVAVRDISKGSEIHVSYGTDKWFRQRNIKLLKVKPAPPKYRVLPGCAWSFVREHRGRIYTGQSIKAGEVLEVSRALIMPAHRVVDNDLQDYVWFKQNAVDVKGAVLLLGKGALYRPPSSGNTSEANLNYTWFNEELYSTTNTSSDADQLLREALVQDNIKCELSMFVVFRASRDILANEELTVPIVQSEYMGRPFRQTFDAMLDPRCSS